MSTPEVLRCDPGPSLDAPVESTATEGRLCFDFDPDERAMLDDVVSSADEAVRRRLPRVFEIEGELLRRVRVVGRDGSRAVSGGIPVEAWHRLSTKDLEWFIQAASSEAFFSSQEMLDMYAEASLSKYDYDDSYDAAYMRQSDGTIADKTAQGRSVTRDMRWSALYRAIVFKKAKEALDRLDAHVRRAETIYKARASAEFAERRAARLS